MFLEKNDFFKKDFLIFINIKLTLNEEINFPSKRDFLKNPSYHPSMEALSNSLFLFRDL